jgi:hypothetical protein
MLAAMDLSHEGDDDKGYVVRLPVPGGGSDLSFFVAREGATYKIVEMGDDDGPFGRYILQLVKQGSVEQAAIWLDRARRGRPGGDVDDPLSGRFSRLWSTNQTERTADAVRLAAGALIAGKKYPEVNELISLFETARQQANAAKAAAISGVLAEFYFSLDRNADAKRIAADLLQQFPQSSTALGMAVHAAYAADGRTGGRAVIDANQTRFAQDPSALRVLAFFAMVFDDVERSSDINRGIISSGRANVGDYNQLAWGDLMIDKVTATTLETVNKGMVLAGSRPASGLMHTAAAVNAVLGKPSDARTTILERLKVDGSPEPTDSDWYVFGLIAEQYGLRDEAVAMYRKVTRPESEAGLSSTSYALAQRRLEALAATRP